MGDIKNWSEISLGFYRFVVAAKVCYEIHLISYKEGTDVLQAPARLYITGLWNTKDGVKFERELLEDNVTVAQCIEAAIQDDKENNQ